MYKILGADQKEYGPVSAEQLRQWITEGRANAQTMVLAEGGAEWKALGSLPEFAAALTGGRAAISQPMSSPPRTNGMAVAGFITGLLSILLGLFCCWFMPCIVLPFNVMGIVFSLIALSQIKAAPQGQGGRGLAVAGLILSVATLIIGIFLLIVFAAMGGMQEVLRELNKP